MVAVAVAVAVATITTTTMMMTTNDRNDVPIRPDRNRKVVDLWKKLKCWFGTIFFLHDYTTTFLLFCLDFMCVSFFHPLSINNDWVYRLFIVALIPFLMLLVTKLYRFSIQHVLSSIAFDYIRNKLNVFDLKITIRGYGHWYWDSIV